MTVGVVTHDAFAEPKDVRHAQKIAQVLLDLLLRQLRIAVRIQQTGFGGQQRAAAVDFDRPAFQDDPGREHRQLPQFCDVLGNRVVEVERRVTAAPGVVGPIRDGAFAHAAVVTRAPNGQGDSTATTDGRPLTRIGGGDVPTIAIDPKDENVVYSASIVMWRTEDGGASWSAVRGSPGGDDYQRVWIDPNDPNLILVVSDQGAVISGNRGASWSNWYNQSTAAVYHVTSCS